MTYHGDSHSTTWTLTLYGNGATSSSGDNGIVEPEPTPVQTTKILQTKDESTLSAGYDATS